MQPCIEQAVQAMGESLTFVRAARAAETLRHTCLMGIREFPNREWLASVIAEVELTCDMLRHLAGDALVDLAKVEALYSLQQFLIAMPQSTQVSTTTERTS